MKTLLLLRHGKSSWNDATAADHDRPLAPRGKRAAPLVGRALRERDLRPALALCSTAKRASDTLDLALAELGGDIPVQREPSLYLCGSAALLGRLRQVEDSVESLMIVGHNPDFHDLAMELVGAGDDGLRQALAHKFPTAACAVIAFETAQWRGVEPGAGRLVEYLLPRKLA